ncbi:MAG: zinc metalloprotease HtpX [Elusimicrobia bacterium CG1_02_63_36]|nr:MAG: zinc metalloprotease HtpX [Elusimicrobia bacterium CG1_02_63_36]PIP82549.1 MAG: protease HtpX [Elusimicrobia bacterium CG22_combo_CG10-13_8_21_14_all_63_91]PJA12928.1 MAG: protease HtpX [Elusimicrobia bacterium CG_4_10_14_0_2_um_filter_63_34]PJB25823.1 MAG: protease HtpX [Elusimicrobia bacterium CG_4_9_14_3_um_filter_62_55]
MKRFILFFAVNAAVIVALSILLNLLGIQPYLSAYGIDYRSLLIFCAVFGVGGAFLSLQISRWMAKRAMGVLLIDPQSPGSDAEAFLVDRVQSLCQRAGLKTLPEIGIYPNSEVNAFATGPSRDRSLLAVSSGLLERMDADAIEGVLGHEIAHIANGDMVTMTLVQGVVNTFVMFFARILAHALDNVMRSDDDGGGLGFFGYMMAVFVLESVLFLLASPIIYWFSRRREFRADAGSAEIAGRERMIHALESLKNSARLVDDRNRSLATLKIHGGASGLVAMLYASHPSLDARIAALKSNF